MKRHSYDRFERSDDHDSTDQVDQSIESPDGSPQEAGEPAPSDEFCDELSPPDSRGDDPSPAADEQSSQTDPPSADGEVASADGEVVPPEDEPWSIDEEADLEVDEAMHLHALLLLLRGLSYREIANTYGRSLIEDGRLVAAAEEERFRRVKHWAGFPSEAVRTRLETAGVESLSTIDHIAVNQDSHANLLRKLGYLARHRPDVSLNLGAGHLTQADRQTVKAAINCSNRNPDRL